MPATPIQKAERIRPKNGQEVFVLLGQILQDKRDLQKYRPVHRVD